VETFFETQCSCSWPKKPSKLPLWHFAPSQPAHYATALRMLGWLWHFMLPDTLHTTPTAVIDKHRYRYTDTAHYVVDL